ncbi:TIM barrel protein [Gymnodinialimonas sp. 2305UL16-5]|uniref:sugar phosphate isomerase/epimerase family protein n=1 Tax=Gymnodinialimonas mytili TaxID=3126503 RepID=UPI0030A72706
MQPEDLLDVAAFHRLGVVQYADNMPLAGLSGAELSALKTKAHGLGIKIELGKQSFIASELARYIDIAVGLDAKILRVALDGPDAAKPVDRLAVEFRPLVALANAAGLRIAIENHFNYPSLQLVDLLRAIDDDAVGICLDVANSICAGEWPSETVEILADDTINLHLKDYVIVPDPFGVGFVIHGCPLGQGRTDCRAVLDALPTCDMSIILEHWLPRQDNMSAARAAEHAWLAQSVTFARDTLGL